jgi:glycosyltransferase involved in cell wall biosynthesis
MLVSICIPQYNRIQFLLRSLQIIEKQSYSNIEIVISDDGSHDSTQNEIINIQSTYKFPIVYHRFENNEGYDRNFRKSIELASGDYCFILGNDDTFLTDFAIEELISFLQNNNFPDIGFCNYVEELFPEKIYRRANHTGIIGSGVEKALSNYSAFSFVAGIIYKKSCFEIYNTSIYDNSVYSQIAINVNMILNGGVLFGIDKPWVLKDILLPDLGRSNSYRENLIRNWKDFKFLDGGLTDVIKVLFIVLIKNEKYKSAYGIKIFRKIFRSTYPYWILDYKKNNALPSVFGLILGLKPWLISEFRLLNILHKIEIVITYMVTTISALLLPSNLFFKISNKIYSFIKKHN